MKIEKLKQGQAVWVRGYADGLGNIDFLEDERSDMIGCLCEEYILYMSKSDFRLDETTKPQLEVPQFVADWYEEHKDNFYLNLHRLAWELIENLDEDDFVPKKALDSDFKRWYHKAETAIQTLINMHQFGYTIEKEKLYRVKLNDHLYFKEFIDSMFPVFVIDDMPGSLDDAFIGKEELALKHAREFGGRLEEAKEVTE